MKTDQSLLNKEAELEDRIKILMAQLVDIRRALGKDKQPELLSTILLRAGGSYDA